MRLFDPRWCGFKLSLGRRFVLAEAFNRHAADGDHYAGVNLLQWGQRHALFIGFYRINGRESWEWSALGSRRARWSRRVTPTSGAEKMQDRAEFYQRLLA